MLVVVELRFVSKDGFGVAVLARHLLILLASLVPGLAREGGTADHTLIGRLTSTFDVVERLPWAVRIKVAGLNSPYYVFKRDFINGLDSANDSSE